MVVTKKLPFGRPDTDLIGDLLAITTISLGVTLLVGGLFMVISDATVFNLSRTASSTQSMAYIIDLFPGMPFSTSWPFDLVSSGMGTVGIVTWIVGVDILLIGLGFWTKHKLAKWVGISVFGVAIWFDFMEFLFFGVLGAPEAVFSITINGLIVYLLFKN